jgi:adenosine deaminase
LRRRIILAVILLAATIAAVRLFTVARDFDTAVTAQSFDGLRDDHPALRAFLYRMPKGGDLHVHLSGAVYAEPLIEWAAQQGLCVRLADWFLVEPPCTADKPSVTETMRDQRKFDAMVNAMSMRFFLPSAAVPSGHDQFFSTFAKFSEVSWRVTPEMTVDMLTRYGAQSVQYAEFMLSFSTREERAALIATIRGQTDFAAMLETLKQNGLDALVAKARAEVADIVGKVDALRNCAADPAKPACKVNYRFIIQVSRNTPIEDVFVQTAFAAALIRAEPRVVALNFVQTEDNQIARRDYTRQMRIVEFLAKDVQVALHAGELWIGLVPPTDLTFHIRQAVEIGGARRIGHGTALAFEHDVDGLLAELRRRPVVIEISLTSSDVILDVRGNDHPLSTYLASGVPVVLSTDDPGVSRIDLTNEYFRAAREHRLGYRTLKSLARNALIYSFLTEPEKRQELARFDLSSAEFEASIAGRQAWPRRLWMLILEAVAPAR